VPGREARESGTLGLGARGESLLRRGTKTPMNGATGPDFHFYCCDMVGLGVANFAVASG